MRYALLFSLLTLPLAAGCGTKEAAQPASGYCSPDPAPPGQASAPEVAAAAALGCGLAAAAGK